MPSSSLPPIVPAIDVYRRAYPSQVSPGDLVRHPTAGALVVDEVRRRADGFTFYGWPPPRTDGQRISLSCAADGAVDLLPRRRDLDAIAGSLGDAAVAARFRPDAAAPLEMVAKGRVLGVRTGVGVWRLDFDPEGGPIAEDEDGTEGEPGADPGPDVPVRAV